VDRESNIVVAPCAWMAGLQKQGPRVKGKIRLVKLKPVWR
jgi:hypothetical protein